MSDKSYVGMFNCFFCGEAAGVLIDRRLKNTLPHNVGVINKEPCSKCVEYMKQGIILISVKNNDSTYRTGGWWVVKEEAVRRFGMDTKILESALKERYLFVADEVCSLLGLSKEDNR